MGYQGQQAHSQGFNIGSGVMGFGAGAVAGAALGELAKSTFADFFNAAIVKL